MAIVNWSSIMNKAKTCMKSPEKKKEIQKQVDGFIISGLGFKTIGSNGNRINNVKVAAERFVEILKELDLSPPVRCRPSITSSPRRLSSSLCSRSRPPRSYRLPQL